MVVICKLTLQTSFKAFFRVFLEIASKITTQYSLLFFIHFEIIKNIVFLFNFATTYRHFDPFHKN